MLDDNIMREVLFARFVNEDSYWGRVADAVLEYELLSKYKEPPLDTNIDPFLELRRDPALMDDAMLETHLRTLDSMALADLLDDIILDPLFVTTEDLEIDLGLRSPKRTPSEASGTSSTRHAKSDCPLPQEAAAIATAPPRKHGRASSDLPTPKHATANQSTSMSSTMAKTSDVKVSDVKASDAKASPAKASRVKASSVKASSVKASGVKASGAKASSGKASSGKAPGAKASRAKATAKAVAKTVAKKTIRRIKPPVKR
eukprot:GEMP01023456.1.p1 GENE.GEMP01023456.1~~GEMP01023456.1.p1  ORF type:complete len:259 (+),score=71.18 GEMP01023456.1:173-949(+)